MRLSLEKHPSITTALIPRKAGEWTWNQDESINGGVSGRLVSTFTPRTAAVFRPLWALNRAGIAVLEHEMLDVVDDVSEKALRRAITDWRAQGNSGPYRRRLEALAGIDLLALTLQQVDELPVRESNAARFAVTCIAFNTPGSERRLLARATDSDDNAAQQWVAAAIDRSRLTTMTGGSADIPNPLLAELIQRPGYLGERAIELVPMVTLAPDGDLLRILCEVSNADDARAESALTAMGSAPATDQVKRALRDALESTSTRRRAAALGGFATHWPDEARPYWNQFLESRAAPLRQTAEVVIPRHGDREDIQKVAEHVSKLIRGKPPSVVYVPPRGSEMISMLVTHADDPDARRALDDLSARWDRLYPELRGWLEEHHPFVAPSGMAQTSEATSSEPEEALMWPPPEVAIEEDGVLIWFEYTDMFETRAVFEELMAANPEVLIIDGDREWLRFSTSVDDPRALVLDLWERAGGLPT